MAGLNASVFLTFATGMHHFELFSRNKRAYAITLAVLWIAVTSFLLMWGNRESFLLLRITGNPISHFFFKHVTHLGDGLFALAAVAWFWWKREKVTAGVVLAGYAISGLAAQGVKHLVAAPRPAPFFAALGQKIAPIDGVELLQSHTSFPSGHTASVFALATALVLLKPWWELRWWLALMLAVLVGYSRVYLGQHFPADVLAGSILGVMSTIAVCLLWSRYTQKRYSKQD